MERPYSILHSHGTALSLISLSALAARSLATNLVAGWSGRWSGSALCLEDHCSPEDLEFPFDGDYLASTDFHPDAESDLDLIFEAAGAFYSNSDPEVSLWDPVLDDFDADIEVRTEQECPLDQRDVREDHEIFVGSFLKVSIPRPARERARFVALGCAVHLAALSLFIAVPAPSLRGLGGTSDKPVYVRLIETAETSFPDAPSRASVDSPASLASRARRIPKPEESRNQKPIEMEFPATARPTEMPEQTKTHQQLTEAKNRQNQAIALRRVNYERSQDGPTVDSKSLHDSIDSTPSVASPERRSDLGAGDEIRTYKDRILSAIHNAVYYPREALGHMVHGKTVVCFTINKDGSLTNVVIMTPSDSTVLDAAALKIVQKASSHFPPVPDSLEREQVTYAVPIVFKKRR